MSLQVEKLEKNMAKLTIEVPAEEFDAAIKNAYNKNKNKNRRKKNADLFKRSGIRKAFYTHRSYARPGRDGREAGALRLIRGAQQTHMFIH